ncbi:dihydrolipoamide acetyltransferase family protein [Vagococcus sp.]|uniref:dihydrolipoamide acetyltransferase family protein n=1 Tax=Vagococcus sp. TaxID=1933889 RepID=UPI003F995179
MAEAITMPTLGLTMTEGTVDQWFKKVGDPISKGEAVVAISSEKLTHDVEATADGILLQIIVDDGGDAPCQEAIGYIGAEGEALPNVTGTTETSEEVVQVEEVKEEISSVQEKPQRVAGERVFATPLARKVADENGYLLEDIIGTGGNGRITRRDVERHTPVKVVAPIATAIIGEGLEGMRKVIAQRMHQSLNQSAQLTLHRKANINALLTFRKELQQKAGDSINRRALSINTLLIKAVSLALKDHPEMNAWYDLETLTQHEAVHVGVAVSVDDGLVVPVIKDVQSKSLSQIGADFGEVTSQAVDGTLPGNLYSGSTFTITNLGSLGIEYFTPILNAPEVGILGVGQTQSKLAFGEDQSIVEIKELPLSLTFDHAVVDGAPAAAFLASIINYLEAPYSLIV